MAVFLVVRSGPQAGHRIRLRPGQSLRIGRSSGSDIAFADDQHMSGKHFSLECLEDGCRLYDLNSRNGSFLNGQRVMSAAVAHGDTVTAGDTKFTVCMEDETVVAESTSATAVFQTPQRSDPSPAPEMPAAEAIQNHVLSALRDDYQPLYAILDAARDIRILALLLHHRAACQSLYEGVQGAKLAQVAPYLVRLEKDSPLLETLVKEGWGNSWGVYLTSGSDFQEVRHHLRHFLQVKLPDGEQVYFRFYDPRVMRVFLPTCTPEDVTQFFGPIRDYLVEDDKPKKLLRFVDTGKGVQKMIVLQSEPEVQVAPGLISDDEEPKTETWAENPLKGKVL